jgi:hypothetical protein
MNVSRESIAAALLTLLQGVNANITYGPAKFAAGNITRKGAIWSKTPPANQPALYQIQVAEHGTQTPTFGAEKWTLDFVLEIYALASEGSADVPDTLINAILDGIDKTLQPKPPSIFQTLGGLVTNCWIEGEIIIGTGTISNQLMMLVPVRCLTGQ